MNATPRPWTIQDGRAGNRTWRLTGGDQFPVCAGDNLADALLIHRAVNSHDAMREALEALCKQARTVMQYTNEYDGQLIQAIANGEAALALAKGEVKS